MRKNSRYHTIKKVGLCLFLSFFLYSCASLRESDKSYLEYAKFYLDELENFYAQEESEYIVYLFSDSCSFCDNIKGNLFDHLDELEEYGTGVSCYIYNMRKSDSLAGEVNRSYFKAKQTGYDRDELISEMVQNQPSTLGETYFFATPSLYLIKDNKFSAIYVGDSDCAKYFDSH